MTAPTASPIADSDARAFRPFDGLAVFAFAFAAHVLFARAAFLTSQDAGGLVLITLASALLLFPRSAPLLIGLALAHAGLYVADMPAASNNRMLTFFVASTVLVAWLPRLAPRRPAFDRDAFHAGFAPSARFLLILLYFFGIFHKINADFLDPDASCAVALYTSFMDATRLSAFGLNEWLPGRHAAIWLTFVAEGLAIALLFSRRHKFLGFLIGVPFHVLIAFTGYAYYIDFSTIVLALYTLFLPEAFYARLNAALRSMAERRGWPPAGAVRRARLALAAVAALAGLTAAVADALDWMSPQRPTAMQPFFALYAAVFLYAVLRFFPPREALTPQPFFRFVTPFSAVVPVLFLINGFSPYIGWKTEAAIAMFSNLHTEGGVSNHLLMPTPPYLFDYQRELARVIRVSDPAALADVTGPGRYIVRYDLDRRLARDPDLRVVYEVDGVRHDSAASTENVYESTPWPARMLLIFKPVDRGRPKACTH